MTSPGMRSAMPINGKRHADPKHVPPIPPTIKGRAASPRRPLKSQLSTLNLIQWAASPRPPVRGRSPFAAPWHLETSRQTHKSGSAVPQGLPENSPPLQRWEPMSHHVKSRRDGRIPPQLNSLSPVPGSSIALNFSKTSPQTKVGPPRRGGRSANGPRSQHLGIWKPLAKLSNPDQQSRRDCPKIAHRFSGGNARPTTSSPEGTAEFPPNSILSPPVPGLSLALNCSKTSPQLKVGPPRAALRALRGTNFAVHGHTRGVINQFCSKL
jgi:hypothetical protein